MGRGLSCSTALIKGKISAKAHAAPPRAKTRPGKPPSEARRG